MTACKSQGKGEGRREAGKRGECHPSMTSMWSQSGPLSSILWDSLDKVAKSQLSMDGQMIADSFPWAGACDIVEHFLKLKKGVKRAPKELFKPTRERTQCMQIAANKG